MTRSPNPLLSSRARSPFWYLLGIALVIALGLATRRFPELLPSMLGKYPGDALWALMVFLGWGLFLRRASPAFVGLVALASCWAVEFSQLYQAGWINEIRSVRLGHLVLGSGFHWADLPAYAIGVALGISIEAAICAIRRNKRGPRRLS